MQNLKQLVARKPGAAEATLGAPAPSQDDLMTALLDVKRLHAIKEQHATLLSNHKGAESRVADAEQSTAQFVAKKHPNAKIWQATLAQAQAQEQAARIALAELELSSDWKTLRFLYALKDL
jgi:hypothetical protein